MSEKTGIQWTDHTFNPWSGCSKLSAGCAHCYAAALPPAMRRHAVWGPEGTRVFAADSYWIEALRWNARAKRNGGREYVFCASTADVFEDRDDLDEMRWRLWTLIALTPHLVWLLLTKRPHVAARFHPEFESYRNAWLGVSVEDQRAADERIPVALTVPASRRFLSCEPLLGPVDLIGNVERWGPAVEVKSVRYPTDYGTGWESADDVQTEIDWVIAGGESGRHARPMHPDWARSLRDQCVAADVPFFFKQWGEHDATGARVGKHAAGDLLDGVRWQQRPEPEPIRARGPLRLVWADPHAPSDTADEVTP